MPDETPDGGSDTVRTDLVQKYAAYLAQQVWETLNQGTSAERVERRRLLRPVIESLNRRFGADGLSKDEIAAIGELFARNLIEVGIFVASSTSSDQSE